jgi:hypothetical protein
MTAGFSESCRAGGPGNTPAFPLVYRDMTTQQDPNQKGRYVYCPLCRRHVLRNKYAAHYAAKHAKGR